VHQGKDATAVLNKNSANFQLTKWPGQVVQLYLGILRKEDVLVAAENADSEKNNEQHCEAYFYLGEFALLKGDRPEAAHLFQKSIATGVQHFVEFSGANAELRRIRPN
jgi:lipoprotein NlpI